MIMWDMLILKVSRIRHAELVSVSHESIVRETLKQVQGDEVLCCYTNPQSSIK
jgi:hypothetical protein